jgi:hypothetical protein
MTRAGEGRRRAIRLIWFLLSRRRTDARAILSSESEVALGGIRLRNLYKKR